MISDISDSKLKYRLGWLFGAVILIVLIGGLYLLKQDNKGSEGNGNRVGNGNSSVNASVAKSSIPEYWPQILHAEFGFSLRYPSQYAEYTGSNAKNHLVDQFGVNKGQENLFVISVYSAGQEPEDVRAEIASTKDAATKMIGGKKALQPKLDTAKYFITTTDFTYEVFSQLATMSDSVSRAEAETMLGGLVFFQPSEAASVSRIDTYWSTYADNQVSVGFEYPKAWTVVKEATDKIVLRSPDYRPSVDANSKKITGDIEITIQDNPKNLTAEALYSLNRDSSNGWFKNEAHDSFTSCDPAGTYFPAITSEGQNQAVIIVPLKGKLVTVRYFYVTDSLRPLFETVAKTVTLNN